MLYKVNIQEIKSLSHDLVVEAESIEKLEKALKKQRIKIFVT